MIVDESFFCEISGVTALWCPPATDRTELARMAEIATERSSSLISAAPDDVAMLWTWLEKTRSRIYARFYMPRHTAGNVEEVSKLSARINTAFKQGASGAQIFLHPTDLDDFVAQIGSIRDDLFFNRDLSIGLDIADIQPDSWPAVFASLARIRAGSCLFVLSRDAGDKSDFVGRIYALLTAVVDLPVDLHFMLGARPVRIEQAMRLVQRMRPDKAAKMRVFISAYMDGE